MKKTKLDPISSITSIPFQITSGLSIVGSFFELFGAISSTLVAIGIIWSGIYLIMTVKSYNQSAKALIENKECSNSGTATTSCKYTLLFETAQKQKIRTTIESSEIFVVNLRYKKGDTVDIVYMDQRPETPRFKVANRIQSGYATILSGCYLILCYWVWVWMVKNSKSSQIASGYSFIVNR